MVVGQHQSFVCFLEEIQSPRAPESSKSTAEAKYRSLAYVTAEIVWIQSLLSELCALVKNKALVWCDSSAAVVVADNPVMHSKFKHVELDLFFVSEKVANGSFQVGHVCPVKAKLLIS
ncbi:hypothetical protein EPI10_029020 [Gossypium australe]|uniref:Uncharacterized protein n=1 Tax=Gossypium australe TaxID=47621 RepID=A0A5B6V095_9ROSI|nr:hypothetical protein EPI10_029020 [Gossypium australe]